jgi:hypothetical protein
MLYGFPNKTTAEIIEEFTTILESGTKDDVHNAFEAVEKMNPLYRYVVVNAVEDRLIAQAKLDALAWNGLDWVKKEEKEAERQALLGDLEHLRSMAQAFVEIYRIKSNAAQPWTKTFIDQYSVLLDCEKDSIETLADCIADVNDKLGNVPASAPEQTAPPTAAGIFNIFHRSLEAEATAAAIAALEACDGDVRASLLESCEKYFMRKIMGDAIVVSDLPAPYLRKSLMFGQYIAGARGAAVDPLFKAYLDVASRLPLKQDDNYFGQAELIAAAKSHLTATGNQQKLKKLAAQHKARLII